MQQKSMEGMKMKPFICGICISIQSKETDGNWKDTKLFNMGKNEG